MGNNEVAPLLWRHVIGGAILVSGIAVCLALSVGAPHRLPTVETAGCEDADAAVVATLKPMLDKSDNRSTLMVSSALRLIADARRACWHGESERGLQLYGTIRQVMARSEARLPDYGD